MESEALAFFHQSVVCSSHRAAVVGAAVAAGMSLSLSLCTITENDHRRLRVPFSTVRRVSRFRNDAVIVFVVAAESLTMRSVFN